MNRRIRTMAAATAAAFALTIGASAAALPSSSSSPQAVPGQNERYSGHTWHFKNCHCGGMSALSSITGMTQQELAQKYPQKTSWQIAFKLGKLDDLKRAVLAQHKDFIERLVAEKRISSSDAAKMIADLQKRLAAIDGKETVILGRPGFMPQINMKHGEF